MKEYIGETIIASATIIAAIIGLLAKKRSRNKQIVKKSENSTLYQANGSITINEEK